MSQFVLHPTSSPPSLPSTASHSNSDIVDDHAIAVPAASETMVLAPVVIPVMLGRKRHRKRRRSPNPVRRTRINSAVNYRQEMDSDDELDVTTLGSELRLDSDVVLIQVFWEGFTEDAATWEPLKNIVRQVPELVMQRFHRVGGGGPWLRLESGEVYVGVSNARKEFTWEPLEVIAREMPQAVVASFHSC